VVTLTDWQTAGIAWLILSVFLAPVVGRMIHDPAACPVCQHRARERAATRRRHPSAGGRP
jgi:hypothetical protein